MKYVKICNTLIASRKGFFPSNYMQKRKHFDLTSEIKMLWYSYFPNIRDKKMKITITLLKKDEQIMSRLANAYRNSYNTLSAGYKSREEMALYTYDYFYQKVRRFAAENEQSNLSRTFTVNLEGQPVGFVRYSKIPEYYKQNQNGETKDFEHGMMDGYEYAWYRKVKFVDDVKLDDSTMILNQIYLDPSVQHKGLGTYILAQTLPKMKEKGVRNLILEYNRDNLNGEKFYQSFGFQPLADTEDLDHILPDREGKTKFCISKVKMVHVDVATALEKANAKIAAKQKAMTAGQVVIGMLNHGSKQY